MFLPLTLVSMMPVEVVECVVVVVVVVAVVVVVVVVASATLMPVTQVAGLVLWAAEEWSWVAQVARVESHVVVVVVSVVMMVVAQVESHVAVVVVVVVMMVVAQVESHAAVVDVVVVMTVVAQVEAAVMVVGEALDLLEEAREGPSCTQAWVAWAEARLGERKETGRRPCSLDVFLSPLLVVLLLLLFF